jgi:ArsR family transcriptional regulator, arsenate/arsenite/antimonite-responsive transcriptional repressor
MAEDEECYCGDLCEAFQLAQSTISQHLKVLREAGLIRGTRCGTAVGYRVDEARVAAFHRWVEDLSVRGALAGASPRPDPES